jgi:hypothetical protein
MKKYQYYLWGIEFLSITAIGILTQFINLYWYLLLIPIVLIIGCKIVEYRFDRSDKMDKVKIQLELLWRLLKYETSVHARITFHRPHKKKKLYKQLIDYVPNGKGKGRSFNSIQGLVSKCIEKKKLVIESFSSDEEYRMKMVTEYNYTKVELQDRSADRRSYLCYPLVNNHTNIVMGVIYLDATKPNVYSDDPTLADNLIIKEVASSIYDILI